MARTAFNEEGGGRRMESRDSLRGKEPGNIRTYKTFDRSWEKNSRMCI
jgi:hypothetical protein